MLERRDLGLDGVCELVPRRFGDARGWFSETWNAERFAEIGFEQRWCQDNHAYSRDKGVLRGLHLQRAPFAQAKLVRCLKGRVFDVAVDIRKGSPRFGHWAGVELTAEKGNQILVPRGFAHGYLTLEPGCEVAYKVDAPYAPDHELSIRYDDPDFAIDWPLDAEPVLAEKDAAAPNLADIAAEFLPGFDDQHTDG